MAETVKIYGMDDLDSAIREAVEEHKKRMASVKDLAKGKEVVVNPKLRDKIVADRVCGKVIHLPLRDILLFSGQARLATTVEHNELRR